MHISDALAFERLVRRKTEFLSNRHILLLAGGPEAVHGELEFAAPAGNLFDQFLKGLARGGGAGLFAALVGLDAFVSFGIVREGGVGFGSAIESFLWQENSHK